MQFNIDCDTGVRIVGWIVPDNPNAIPSIEIIVPGRALITHAANVDRPDLRKLGVHGTGRVGFFVDHTIVPDIESLHEIEIRDATTKIVLHRRFEGLRKHLFHLELCLPIAGVDTAIARLFTLSYQNVERFPFDTLYSIINNQTEHSLYASGRPSWLRYDDLLKIRDYVVVATLRHPLEELASRLLFAKQADEASCITGLEPLLEFTSSLALDNPRHLASAFHGITRNQANAIASPFVRTLACRPDEAPERKHVGIALDNLAKMNLVGLYNRYDDFKAGLTELLEQDLLTECDVDASQDRLRLASDLARLEVVRKLLTWDLLLYSFVDDAISSANASLVSLKSN